MISHLDGAYRHAQDAACDKSGLFVDAAIKARIGVSVVYDDTLTDAKYMACNATVIEYADFAVKSTLGHARIQLVRSRIVQELRSALGIEFPGGHFDQPGQDFVQCVHARQLLRNTEQ